jgi:YggT family protein
MINNAVLFLLEAILGLLSIAFLLRFYFQLTRASFQNQFAHLIVTVTNFAVKPLRRIIPSLAKVDISTLLLAYLTQIVLNFFTFLLNGFPIFVAGNTVWLVILGLALVGIVSISLSIFLYAVLIQAVLSWINPHTPIAPTLHSLTNPVLRLFRKYIPPAGNFDLSPLVFIIAAQLLLSTILAPLKNNLLSLL